MYGYTSGGLGIKSGGWVWGFSSNAISLNSTQIYFTTSAGGTSSYLTLYGSNNGFATLAADGSSGYVSFKTNGSEKLRIDSSGNVGIGTTSPNVPLDFGLTLGNKIGLYGGAYGIGIQSNVLQIFANNIGDRVGIGYNPSSFIENFSVMATGNIGIGTTSPTNILSLGGTAARTIWMERNTTAATAGQGLTLSSGGAIAGTADLAGGDLTLKSGISTGTGTSAIHFYTATAGSTGTSDNTPTEKMTILGSGSVGIGTTAPYSKLDVIGSNSIHIAGTAVDSGGYFDTAGSNAFYLSGGAKYSSYTTDYVFMAKEVAASGQIMENGNAYFYANTGLTAGNTFTPTKVIKIIGSGAVANTLYLSGGKVGIGTSGAAAQTLEVNGSIRMGALITGAGGAVAVYRDANGDLADSTSSARYKTDITNMENVLPQIMQLNAVRFKWNGQTSTPGMADFGMISEEVNKILPDLVTFEVDGTTPRGLKYEKMGLFAIKGLQEQQTQLNAISAKLNGLVISTDGTTGDGTVAGVDLSSPFVTSIKNILAALGINFGSDKSVKVQKLCVGETCIDENQLKDLLDKNQNSSSGSGGGSGAVNSLADVLGCTNKDATNYNASANKDDGSCTLPALGDTPSEPLPAVEPPLIETPIIPPTEEAPSEILGCTNKDATNYNASANKDDGSCTLPETPSVDVIPPETPVTPPVEVSFTP